MSLKRGYVLGRQQLQRVQSAVRAFEATPTAADQPLPDTGIRPWLIPFKVSRAIPKMDWGSDTGTGNSGPGQGLPIRIKDMDIQRFGLVPGKYYDIYNLYPDAVPVYSIAWCTHFAGQLYVVAVSCSATPAVATPTPPAPEPTTPTYPTKPAPQPTTFSATNSWGWPMDTSDQFVSQSTGFGFGAGGSGRILTPIGPPPPP